MNLPYLCYNTNMSRSTITSASGTLWRRLQEGGFLILASLAVFLFVALITYNSKDPGWSYSTTKIVIINKGGRMGAWFADLFFYLFGYIAYLFPIMIGYGGLSLFQNRFQIAKFHQTLWALRVVGFMLALAAGCGLASFHFEFESSSLPVGSGGVLGILVKTQLMTAMGGLGSTLLLLASFLAGITLTTGLSWFGLMDRLAHQLTEIFEQLKEKILARAQNFSVVALFSHFRKNNSNQKSNVNYKELVQVKNAARTPSKRVAPTFGENPSYVTPAQDRGRGQAPAITTKTPLNTVNAIQISLPLDPTTETDEEWQPALRKSKMQAKLPSIDLLESAIQENIEISSKLETHLEALSREVEARLSEFGIQARVVQVLPGPVITRFELDLAPGIKVSRITGLSKDLARSLSVSRVRVVEVIPGKSVIGLEVPNEDREIVKLRSIIESSEYSTSNSPLSLALGKDIAGSPVVVNLAKMPHLLVAGTTGSGKSVGIHAMLLSLLYKATPLDIRLILIDPKMLELSVYEGIPHLLTPVVTDMKDAANALRWCVAEMERRYQIMASLGVRNLVGYNRKVFEAEQQGTPLFSPIWKPEMGGERPVLKRIPYIVVVIDEFADMMMVVGKKVEELIARIAQKARAAGIHLVLATQRPSVDVITGLIKANVPTRIAFQVSSRIDSRTILDQQGAEQLLGQGDMLYLPPGSGVPARIHGAFVSDEEVHAVVKWLREQGEPDFTEDILRSSGFGAGGGIAGGFNVGGIDEGDGESDELYDQAVHIVLETRKPSISHLQRRLKIGYNRAARLIETMEASGIVSPVQSNGTREVLAPGSHEE